MRQFWIIVAAAVLVVGTESRDQAKDFGEARPPLLATNLLKLLPKKLSVPSADPEHAEKVFQNFTSYVNNLNITGEIAKVTSEIWAEAVPQNGGAEGRAAVVSTPSMGAGLLMFFQEYMNNVVDEFLEAVLTAAYYFAPEATDNLLAFINVTEEATAEEEEARVFAREGRADNLASDFLSLVASKVSSLTPDAAKMQECPTNFDTYRKCFYVNSIDYMSHISKRVSAFTANLFGFSKKKL